MVGAFVIAFGVALIAGVLWLASGVSWRQKVDLYLTMMEESVAGLSVNAPVKFNGVDVGQVRLIKLDPANPERVILTLAIQRGTPITVDTVAVLRTQGLTGISSIELAGGARGSAPLQSRNEDEPVVIPSKPSLSARLEDVLTNVLAKVDRTSSTLDDLMSEDNRQAVASSLADIAKLSAMLAARAPTIDTAIAHAGQTLQHSSRVAGELSPVIARVGRSAEALEKMGQDTATASAQAASAVTGVAADIRQLSTDTAPEMQRLLAELRALTASLRRFSDAAERSPSSLLFGRRPVANGPGEVGQIQEMQK